VAYANIPAFIATLGGLLAWRGAIKGISRGNTIPIGSTAFKAIGQSYLAPVVGTVLAAASVVLVVWIALRRYRRRKSHGLEQESITKAGIRAAVAIGLIIAFTVALNRYAGIPIPFVIFLAVALIGVFLTQQTTFGRYLYAIGGNSDAARLSGI